METINLRLTALRDTLKSSLWVFPAIAVVIGVAAALALEQLGDRGAGLAMIFVGSADSARSVLSTIAGSTITVTSLTFSLTVVALQVASGQFTPRLMRTFLSDRGNQTVLAVFLGTFAYSLTLLQKVQAESDRIQRSVPAIGVTVAVLAALASVGALVYFIHHLTVQLRVDKVMQTVADDTIRVVRAAFDPAVIDDDPPSVPEVPDDAVSVASPHSGYLTGLAVESLVDVATKAHVSIRMRPAQGDWVVEGTTIAWVWPSSTDTGRTRLRTLAAAESRPTDAVDKLTSHDRDLPHLAASSDDGPDAEEVDRAARQLVTSHIHIASSRTLESAPSFGIRQLVDIAIRALSPGINDPTTAVEGIRQITRILVVLGTYDLGTIRRIAGPGSVILPRPDFGDHLRLAVDQILRYGATEPAILRALAVMLRDLAEVCEGDTRRDAILVQTSLIADALDATDLPDGSASEVRQVLDAVTAAARGEVVVTDPWAD